MKRLFLFFFAFVLTFALSAQNDTIINEDFSSGSIPPTWSVSHLPDTINVLSTNSHNSLSNALHLLNHENQNNDGIYIYPEVAINIPDGGASGLIGVDLVFDAQKAAIRSYLSFKDAAGTVMAQLMIGDEGNGDGSGVYLIKNKAVTPPTDSRTTNGDSTYYAKIYTHSNAQSHHYSFILNTNENTFSVEIEGDARDEAQDVDLFFDASELASIEFVAARGWSGSDTHFYLDDIMVVEYDEAFQFITFSPIDPVHIDDAVDIVLEENSSVGLPISYVSSDESVATIINGHTLHPVSAGWATITASQAGNATYDPALDVERDVYFAEDTAIYYVRADGDNSQNGYSEATAFASLSAASTAAVQDGMSVVYRIDVADTITNNSTCNLAFVRDEDISVVIEGNGANQTLYQMKNDADFDAMLAGNGNALGRFFQTPRNSGAGSLDIEIRDMSIRNFGFTNTNGGALFNITTEGADVDVTMKRCNIERGAARAGALVQINNEVQGTMTLEDCYLSEIYSINNSAYESPIKIQKTYSFVAKNCVFSRFAKAISTRTNWRDSRYGTLISFMPNNVSASLTLINNTFIGDSALYPDMTVDQSAIYIKSTVADVPVSIANNLFVGNATATPSVNYYDIHVDGSSSSLAFNNCSHNVMNAQSGFDVADNDTSSLYTYDAAEINFTMDGAYPELFTTATGVKFVKANGTSVLEKGLAALASEYDIEGNLRGLLPSVGAYEASAELVTAFTPAEALKVSLYPNPVRDLLQVDGAQLSIYNVAGQLVRSYEIINGQVDLSDLSSGLYIVNVKDAAGAPIAVERLVKE